MAFPVIPTTGNGRLLSQNQTNVSGTRTFPNLSSLTKNSGDLLIAICIGYERGAAGASFSSWDSGFSELADVDGGASTMAVGIATKTSTGSETGTPTVLQAGASSGHCVLFLMSISGWHGTTPPEFTALAVGTGAAADPAALDPSGWASEDTLWIAVAGSGETNTGGSYTGLGTPTAPTNYGSANSPGISIDAVGGVHGAVAFRQNATGSEDVGTWTGVDVTNARNCALLIAIRPVAAPVVNEETGSGIRGFSGAAHREGLRTKAGLGVLGTRRYGGTAVLGAVGSGVSQKIAGTSDKTGSGVRGFVGAASDAFTATEAGSGTLVRVASGSDAFTATETGQGVRGLTGSAADAATFTETGAATLGRSASGTDATTFTETGAGILNAVGSGVAVKVGGATEKTGSGIRELKGSGADATTFTETGAGIRAFVGSGSDATTFTELGAGTLARVGSGTDAVEFTERGSGILAAVGSGPKEVGGGVTYVKTGLGRIGAQLATAKTGSGVLGRVGSGVAVKLVSFTKAGAGILGTVGYDYIPTGAGVLGRIGSGVAVKIAGGGETVKTGSATRGFVGAAADAFTATETGSATRILLASGSDATTFTETGVGKLNASGSGASVRAGGANKTGAGVRGHSALGADAVAFTETGTGNSSRVGSGTDAAAFAETGTGIRGHVGSGAAFRGAAFEKTGTGVSAHTGGGFDATTYTENGSAALIRSASGFDAATFTERGSGVLAAHGSGAKFKLGEFVKFGSATTAIIGSGSSEVSMQLPPSGTVSSSHTGRFSRVRVGRITRAREGGVVT